MKRGSDSALINVQVTTSELFNRNKGATENKIEFVRLWREIPIQKVREPECDDVEPTRCTHQIDTRYANGAKCQGVEGGK